MLRKSSNVLVVAGLVVLFAVFGCGRKDLSASGSDGARMAAEYFYELLSKGDAKAYVDNMSDAALMDSSKYGQFVDLMKQFLHEETELRGGIVSASATRERMVGDTVGMVFLNVEFGDSTREEVMLPVVYTRGRWWIR